MAVWCSTVASRFRPLFDSPHAPTLAQYRDGVMLAADTLASYGSLAMFKVGSFPQTLVFDCQRRGRGQFPG